MTTKKRPKRPKRPARKRIPPFITRAAFRRWLCARPRRVFPRSDARHCALAEATGLEVGAIAYGYKNDERERDLPPWARAFIVDISMCGRGSHLTGANCLAYLDQVPK